jgi:hypothetical protein
MTFYRVIAQNDKAMITKRERDPRTTEPFTDLSEAEARAQEFATELGEGWKAWVEPYGPGAPLMHFYSGLL